MMIANSDKIEAIIIGQDKRETKGHIINLGNVKITSNDMVDLLSVTMDNKLKLAIIHAFIFSHFN